MNVELRYFGFFDELGLKIGAKGTKLVDNIGAPPSAEIGQITSYLTNGWICVEAFGQDELDVLASRPVVVGAMRILTDGLWVWPNVVAYYVEHHGLSVPLELVERMRENNWEVPEVGDAAFDAIVDALVGQPPDDTGLDEILKTIAREQNS